MASRRNSRPTSTGRRGSLNGAPPKKKFLESDAPLASPSSLLASQDLPVTCHFQAAHFTTSNLDGEYANEDRVMCEKPVVVPCSDANLYTVGVLDGHGGAGASDIVSKCLPEAVSKRLLAGASVVEAYTDSMADIEMKLALLSRDLKMTAGTCVLSCTVFGHHVWCANLGDCRAALVPLQLADNQSEYAPKVSSLIWLSQDHKISSVDEVQRIHKAGGKIVNGAIMGLTPSRTLGDFDVKSRVQQDVISIVPEVRCHQLDSGSDKAQALLVCATDGVWDVVTGQDVCHLIDTRKDLLKLKADSTELVLKGIAEDLVKMSRAKGSPDDSTAVVGFISVTPKSKVDVAVPIEASNNVSGKFLVSI